MKRKLIQLKVTEEFKKRVEKAARSVNQTMTGYITECVVKDLKEKGKNVKSSDR